MRICGSMEWVFEDKFFDWAQTLTAHTVVIVFQVFINSFVVAFLKNLLLVKHRLLFFLIMASRVFAQGWEAVEFGRFLLGQFEVCLAKQV